VANETTAAVQAAAIASQVIRNQVIQAHLPKMTALGLMAQDSMDGEGSNTVRYVVDADLGAASAGTEGVDLTPTVALSLDTSVEVTPTEGVADMALITEDTVLRRLGGANYRSVKDVFASEDKAAISKLLAPDIARLTSRAMQKIVADAVAMAFASPTVQKGTTNTDLTMTALIQTIRGMKILQPHRPQSEWCFWLPTAGIEHLQIAAIATSGGFAGTLWGGGQARYNIANAPSDDLAAQSLLGDILGYQTYELDDEFNQLANGTTDVLGLMFCRGDGKSSPDSYAGKPPSFVYVERSPLDFAFQFDASLRSLEVISNARYGFGSFAGNQVGILIDND
jgi:hypothetical protein